MNKNLFKSIDLQNALEEARTAFLGEKISIDDVSNDIRSLEKELNTLGAKDDFIFLLASASIPELGQQIEDYNFNAPVLHRLLQWKKHGDSWRLFYNVIWLGWDLYSLLDNPHEHCSIHEVDAIETLIKKQNSEDGKVIYNLPAGTELLNKPLIDTSADIRFAAHPYLSRFVESFARDWTENKYRRSHNTKV